jgi:hypothetical protein
VEDDSNNEGTELARLRGLGAWMRDVGALELVLGDVRIKLAPRQPEAPGRALCASDSDEKAELDEEEKKLAAMSQAEREHYKYWRRLTRSSGAPIPPFKAPKETDA